MSFGDTFAFCAFVIGVIAVTGMLLDAYKRRLANREAELKLRARIAEAERDAGTARGGDLEERLRVLERIATDPARDLDAAIAALRAPQVDRETA